MAPVLSFRSLSTSATPADARDRAVCPRCHTVDATPMSAVVAGAAWRCARCAQRWDIDRLTTVADYDAWVVAHLPVPPLSTSPTERAARVSL